MFSGSVSLQVSINRRQRRHTIRMSVGGVVEVCQRHVRTTL